VLAAFPICAHNKRNKENSGIVRPSFQSLKLLMACHHDLDLMVFGKTRSNFLPLLSILATRLYLAINMQTPSAIGFSPKLDLCLQHLASKQLTINVCCQTCTESAKGMICPLQGNNLHILTFPLGIVVELYLSTLTLSTVADFHGGRVPENYFTCRI
jgi:hypothetical protein